MHLVLTGLHKLGSLTAALVVYRIQSGIFYPVVGIAANIVWMPLNNRINSVLWQ